MKMATHDHASVFTFLCQENPKLDFSIYIDYPYYIPACSRPSLNPSGELHTKTGFLSCQSQYIIATSTSAIESTSTYICLATIALLPSSKGHLANTDFKWGSQSHHSSSNGEKSEYLHIEIQWQRSSAKSYGVRTVLGNEVR